MTARRFLQRTTPLPWAEAHLARELDHQKDLTIAQMVPGSSKPDAPFASDGAAHERAVSLTRLDIAEGYTRNHLLPVGGTWKLRDLNARRVDEWAGNH